MMKFLKKHVFILFLGVIVALGVSVRSYKFSNPIADWHSWRQADTAAVARNFRDLGFDPFRPRYDDLSNIQSGKNNLEGWRMVEFPLYQSIAYGLYTMLPQVSIEQALRLTSIAASIGTIILLAYIGKQLKNSIVGLGSAFMYAVLPYSFFYGRSILPEPLMVFLSLLALFAALKSTKSNGVSTLFLLIVSTFSAAFALLVKPFAVFLLIPLPLLFITSVWNIVSAFTLLNRSFTRKVVTSTVLLGIFFVIAIVPLYVWRQWIVFFPEGIPVSNWLYNEGNLRFKGAWFHWLFAERVSKLILGYWGIALFILGILSIQKKWVIVYSLLFGSLLFFIVIARGNVQHDYYQQLILPVISLCLGFGIEHLISPRSFIAKLRNSIVLLFIVLFTVAFSWFEIRGFYWINRPEIVEAGKVADSLLPPDAKVIAPYNGDTTFLYQTKRQGWPIGFDIEEKIKLGATHYVTVSPTDADGETKALSEEYEVIVRNDTFAIIDLTKPNSASN